MVRDKIILLVEDNSDDEILTLRTLEKNNIDNEVIGAHDGAEALDYLFGKGIYSGRDTRILSQVVLLDLTLPKVDGFSVLRKIRMNDRTKRLPVVILTASGEEQVTISGYAAGANSCVRKPVEFANFVKTVRHLGMYWLLVSHTSPISSELEWPRPFTP